MQALASAGAEDTEAASRKLKLRLLGNIRLVAELFKQKALGEKIIHACLASLIGDPKGTPTRTTWRCAAPDYGPQITVVTVLSWTIETCSWCKTV